MSDTKKCTKCGTVTDNYGRSNRTKDGLRSQCKECDREYHKARRARHPEIGINNKLKARYGISLDEYNGMLQAQGGTCAMCDATALDETMCVDHNHDTGEVRAILCKPCNTMLGMSGDSVARLQAGIDYLKEHGSYESIV